MHQIHLKAKKGAELPACSYGAACTRKGCIYKHPPPQAKLAPLSEAPVCVAFILGKCPYGSKCYNRHPSEAEAARIRERNARTPCRYGSACLSSECLFKHPPKEMCRYGLRCNNKNCLFLHPDLGEVEEEVANAKPAERAPEDQPLVFPPSEAFRKHLEMQAALEAESGSSTVRNIPTVRVPKDVFVADYNRNHGVYTMHLDPFERFIAVNKASPSGVIDLHYLTTEEVLRVLDAALAKQISGFDWEFYDEDARSLFVITGVGRHTADKNRVLIFDVVLEHFLETKRPFKIAKDTEGKPTGFLLSM